MKGILYPNFVKDHPIRRKVQMDRDAFFKEVVVPSGYPLFTWSGYLYAVDWSDLLNPKMVELGITVDQVLNSED